MAVVMTVPIISRALPTLITSGRSYGLPFMDAFMAATQSDGNFPAAPGWLQTDWRAPGTVPWVCVLATISLLVAHLMNSHAASLCCDPFDIASPQDVTLYIF